MRLSMPSALLPAVGLLGPLGTLGLLGVVAGLGCLMAGCVRSHRDLCEAQVRAGCELRYRCCSTAEELFDLEGVGGVGDADARSTYATSEGECIDRLLPACRSASAALDEAVALGRVTLDEARASECTALLQDARDTCDLALARAAVEDAVGREGACALVSVGLVNDGGACAAAIECADDGQCLFEDPANPAVDDRLAAPVGACRNPARVGESCLERACLPPLRCIASTCQELPRAGEACPDFQCGVDLTCVDGTCAPLPDQGEACDFQCVSTSYCETTVEPRVCQRQKQPGDPCRSENFNECPSGDLCTAGRCPGVVDVALCTGSP